MKKQKEVERVEKTEEEKDLELMLQMIPEGLIIGGNGNYKEISDKLSKGMIYHKIK